MKKAWGITGLALIQICYLPQLIRIIQTRQVEGISPLMYVSLVIGLTCYLIYSIKIKDWVYIVSNVISLISSATILVLVLIYGR